ncbi:uncharacterized protein LOC129909418 [Episyrphus balteatus]|uniref:uncharacterized protein LOC129909418 n=1 Tax=Episyrphus balteatus TaxID=286459 RepID=UPI002484F2A5|nr:uncharacterized protein LOC129909418 [Episyrphus balteatus]
MGKKVHRNDQEAMPRILKEPFWERCLQKKISKLRAELGRLTAFLNGRRTKKVLKQIGVICPNTQFSPLTTGEIIRIKDKKTQQLAVTAKRLARYKKCRERKQQNRSFTNDERMFYRNAVRQNTDETIDHLPNAAEATSFWKDIWEKSENHEQSPSWLVSERLQNENTPQMPSGEIIEEEVAEAIRSVSNWKAPGPDNIHNIWIKKLPLLHKQFALNFTTWLNEPQAMPEFLMQGNTFLLPKNGHTPNPTEYRPTDTGSFN